MSELPITSSTGVATKLFAETQTVTAHYVYPPSV